MLPFAATVTKILGGSDKLPSSMNINHEVSKMDERTPEIVDVHTRR